MRLGISLGMAGLGLREQLAVARRAERAGADSLSSLEAGYDVFALAAALAGESMRARVFSGVATWVRPPVATARAAATVDELGGGRFVLGLGTMPRAWSSDYYGISADRPVARMREYVRVVRGALGSAGEPFHHRGEFFEVRGYRLPSAPVRSEVPIHLGATGAAMARLAGEVADGVLVNFVCTPDWLDQVVLPAVRAGERAEGRRVDRGLLLCCAVSDDRRKARSWLRGSLAGHLRVPYFHRVAEHAGADLTPAGRLAESGDTEGALAAIPDALVERIGVAGGAREVAERLRPLVGRLDHVQLMPPRHLHGPALAEAVDGILEVLRMTGGSVD